MSKSTKITVAAAGAIVVAGALAAAPAPASAAPAAGIAAPTIQDIYQGAGLHQDKHITDAAAKKKNGSKKPGPKKKK
jgi:hypothetical protein